MAPSPRVRLYYAALQRCRELRRHQTPAEQALWNVLRAKRFRGLKFRRQHVIMHDLEGPDSYVIADFYCHAYGLIVEVDGGLHQHREEQDHMRDFMLAQLGYHTLRFSNEEVLTDIEQVLRKIAVYLRLPDERKEMNSPSPLRGGGRGRGMEA